MRHLEKLVVRVAASLKVVAMIVDDRMLQGTVPWHSFMRPGGEQKAAFRSDGLPLRTSMASTRKLYF